MLVVIDGVLDAEEVTINTYRALIDPAEDANDPVIKYLVVAILSDKRHTEPTSADSIGISDRLVT